MNRLLQVNTQTVPIMVFLMKSYKVIKVQNSKYFNDSVGESIIITVFSKLNIATFLFLHNQELKLLISDLFFGYLFKHG